MYMASISHVCSLYLQTSDETNRSQLVHTGNFPNTDNVDRVNLLLLTLMFSHYSIYQLFISRGSYLPETPLHYVLISWCLYLLENIFSFRPLQK